MGIGKRLAKWHAIGQTGHVMHLCWSRFGLNWVTKLRHPAARAKGRGLTFRDQDIHTQFSLMNATFIMALQSIDRHFVHS